MPDSDRPLAVLFDMDGVLFNSEPLHIEAWRRVLGPLGVDYDESWFHQWIGVSDEVLARRLIESDLPDHDDDALLDAKRAGYRELVGERLEPYAGVDEALDLLADKGFRLALCTSSRRVEAELCLRAAGLYERFIAITTSEDVEHLKPAPDPYRAAAASLSVDAADCVAIEDSLSGVTSAREAGCQVFAVATMVPVERFVDAHRVFASTMEAIEAVLELGASIPE